MKLSLTTIAIASAAGTLFAGSAVAESTIGIQPSGTSASATARLNVKVTVPTIVVLKVGTAGTTVDTTEFKVGATGVTGAVPNNSLGYASGTVPPLLSVTPTSVNVAVAAWTNGASDAKITCARGSLSGTTDLPYPSDIIVASSGTNPPSHPGSDLSACDGTTFSTITKLTTYAGSWDFGYTGNLTSTGPGGYTAGNYGNVVTYTALAL